MANRLMTPVVHQALHGYSDGHRLISSSLPLSGADARTMVVMSDLSGPGVKPEASGYVTGYPLEGVGKYVLARTWAAPEMPRPGCVWTHSLIIDNADLAPLVSPSDLLSMFRRPIGSSPKPEYIGPTSIPNALQRPLTVHRDRAWGILNALYAAPEQAIVAEAGQAGEDDLLVTAIWMQQWPRLRRAFGFCTLAGIDRSGKGVPLDLQLVRLPDRHVRSRFPNAVMPSEIPSEPALEPLIADLEGRDNTKIREFLRRTGGDVAGGRRAMLPLCLLHSSLFTKLDPDLPAAVHILGSLDSLGKRQARSVRALIARRAMEDIDDIDDAVFDFVVETLEQGARLKEHSVVSERLGMALWRRSPVRFIDAIDAGGIVGQASANALATIAAPELVKGLRNNPSLAERIVYVRPDLLERADFWSIPSVDEKLAAGVDAADAGRAAAALLAAGRVGPAHLIIARADPGELASALEGAATEPVLEAWLHELIRVPGKTAAVLASGRISHRSIIVGLARVGEPDTVPNDYGDDPWLVAIRAARKTVGQPDEDYLAAFLMSRALGFLSRSQAELIRFAYTTLYRALEQSRLPADVERMVARRLDRGGWFSWDNCSRLRETVVSRFVDRHLDPETFSRLTEDRDLATSLIDQAAWSGRGRRYLGEVRKRLEDAGQKGDRARADYIAGKVK